MKGWSVLVAVVGFFLWLILFSPRPPAEISDEERQSIQDEYLQMLEKRNELQRELNELEELRLKLQTGKAWSA